ncbi:uncharacterized protein, partial [Labrus bergylta]|uniref:uncharacterized protein n=1 Tax=Labrus bergylta TaxID=56723 RepID=UPI003313605D
ILAALLFECKGEDRVIQPTEDVFASEADTVTLGCTFETTNPYPNLFWYRQEMGDFPKYMLRCYSKDVYKAPEFQTDKFNATINGISVPMKIQKLQLTDSAVYYCALRPTCKGEDRVIQPTEDVIAYEGDTVTLGCTFETITQNPSMFWYRQEIVDFPKYMFRCYLKQVYKAPEFQTDRFKPAINGTSVPLKIQKLQLTDSAVYYCALRPTVTGNTTTLYKNLWREDNTILHNIH